jgi:hypothetical protein
MGDIVLMWLKDSDMQLKITITHFGPANSNDALEIKSIWNVDGKDQGMRAVCRYEDFDEAWDQFSKDVRDQVSLQFEDRCRM